MRNILKESKERRKIKEEMKNSVKGKFKKRNGSNKTSD